MALVDTIVEAHPVVVGMGIVGLLLVGWALISTIQRDLPSEEFIEWQFETVLAGLDPDDVAAELDLNPRNYFRDAVADISENRTEEIERLRALL